MSRHKTVLLVMLVILTIGFTGCSRPGPTVWKLSTNQAPATDQSGKAGQ